MREKRSPSTHRTPSQTRRHNKTYGATPKAMEADRVGHRARYKLKKEGLVKEGDGKDVDHKRPLSKGGTNARKNLRVVSASKNRGHGMSPGGTKAGTSAKRKVKRKAKKSSRKRTA